MPIITILGAQWGDEGKGKVVDQLSEGAGMVIRFSGGDNAGHTVINPYGEFKLHIVPSGIFHPNTTCVIGNGVVINPARLITEIDNLINNNIDISRLVISDRAHLVMPYHTLLDELEEKSRADSAIGTTLRGIGPAFTDKTARLGIRAGDLLDKKGFFDRLYSIIEYKNNILTKVYGVDPLSAKDIFNQYSEYGERLTSHIKNASLIIQNSLSSDELIILEGAQGALLDPDFGTYPYATSSSPLAAGACQGSGISPKFIDGILGVFKAYCTRVGGGPFPTELNDDTGNLIREQAHEFGTTTGRPRRCGWFDAVAGRFSHQINGFTGIVITRLDVFDVLPKLKVCSAYEINGKIINYFPTSNTELGKCRPVYEELDGWQSDTTEIREFNKLPAAARKYIAKLEELIGCPTNIVCVGPKREQTIEAKPIL
ncbi:MAG: adenylosuccinate synthase [Dehalococcoidia bacterium]|nr:MAG: adenylosuccinate synthase [Dehalococcoidia bacterium]